MNHSAQRLLDRFIRYVQIDTTACDTSTTYPSSPGQLVLGKLIAAELRAMGAIDVEQTDKGIVFATLPGVKAKLGPVVAWIAHLDTSPETTGNNVKPMVHENYQGEPIPLPGKPGLTLDPAKSAELAAMVGKTIITTDGSTLLGADDKAGVAVIIEAAHRLLEKPDLPRGTIRLCLTCDEEIGKGTDHLDIQHLGADWAYTLDGGGTSEIDTATFSADLAEVIVHGVNIHPAIAKDRMTNALRMAGMLLERLPRSMAPETTEGNKGFCTPTKLKVESTVCVLPYCYAISKPPNWLSRQNSSDPLPARLRLISPRAALKSTSSRNTATWQTAWKKLPRPSLWRKRPCRSLASAPASPACAAEPMAAVSPRRASPAPTYPAVSTTCTPRWNGPALRRWTLPVKC